jgi:hypothetical protein
MTGVGLCVQVNLLGIEKRIHVVTKPPKESAIRDADVYGQVRGTSVGDPVLYWSPVRGACSLVGYG